MELLYPFLASFVMVFLKGMQTQNVIHKNYKSAIVVSYAMAVADIAIISLIVSGGWDMLLPIGTGGTLGIVGSMYIHSRYIKK
jgi:hypothetical protein